MTLTPEPRPARRPFARDPDWPTRAQSEYLEARFTDLSVQAQLIQETDARVTAVFDTYLAQIRLFTASPGEARRARKQLRLVTHYQKKLDRIPTWKRNLKKGTK